MPQSIEDDIDQFLGDLHLYHPVRNVVVLVEDLGDISFWESILTTVNPQLRPNFPLLAANGKSVLRKYVDYVSKQFFICADTDNDCYHQTVHSTWLHPRKPYIYQTYTHSRENHLIHPKHLEICCKNLVHKIHDFETDFKIISTSFYDWLMLWLFFTDDNRKFLNKLINKFAERFAWDTLKKRIERLHFDKENSIEMVRNQLTSLKMSVLELQVRLFEDLEAEGLDYLITEFNDFKTTCPILPEESLWFVQGHIAFDSIMLPYFTKGVQLMATELANIAVSKEEKNRWQKRANETNYRDTIILSYINYLPIEQPYRFMELIKKDILKDFNIII